MSVFSARVPKSRWSHLLWTAPPAFIGGVLLVFSFFLFFFSSVALGVIAGLASLGLVIMVAIWLWPNLGLTILATGGAVHAFIMLLVFNLTGPGIGLKVAQSWKEVIVLIVLAKVVHLVLIARRRITITTLDFLIALFLILGMSYLLFPGTVENEDIDFMTRVFGLRADAFFFLAYFVGRGFFVTQKALKVMIIAFMAVSFIIAIIAPFQFLAPTATNVFFDSIGFSDYLNAQRGDSGTYYAIRQNEIPGLLIPRAASLLLSDLALAFYMLVALPISAAVFIVFTKPSTRAVMNVLVLLNVAALVLTVTRTAIVAAVPAMIALFARWRGIFWGGLLAVQLVIAGTAGAYVQGYSFNTVQEIFSSQDQSVQAHIQALKDSVDIMQEYPFGRGLGTAGTIAQRFGAAGGVTNESWYFQISTELGVLGMLLWVAITVVTTILLFVRYGQARSPWLKALCLGLACSMVGYAFASITLHAWEALSVAIIYWLFAGFAVSGPGLERQWQQQEVAAAR